MTNCKQSHITAVFILPGVPKVSRSASIRRDIDRKKRRQDAADFAHVLRIKDGVQVRP